MRPTEMKGSIGTSETDQLITRGNMALRKSSRQLVEDAAARVRTVPIAEAQALLREPKVLFVDIRDARELDREGTIPGAFHAPRGMLEFWVDPDSP